jgi:hypothetical protein
VTTILSCAACALVGFAASVAWGLRADIRRALDGRREERKPVCSKCGTRSCLEDAESLHW